MTKSGDHVVLDTNVLLAATDEGHSAHAPALAAIDGWPASGVALYTSRQILREYLAVATRPAADNGLGLAREDALTNAQALRARLRVLDETSKVVDSLLDILGEVECRGKSVHDANIVATMLAQGVETLVTLNTADFRRFAGRIRLAALGEPPAGRVQEPLTSR